MPKVLIIEDNPNNMYLMTYILENRGFTVLQANNGIDGIAKAQAADADIILLDIQLPGMDGYEVAGNLIDSSLASTTAIVAVTSYAMPGDKEKAMASGCTGYIEKPIDPDTFADQVISHLDEGNS